MKRYSITILLLNVFLGAYAQNTQQSPMEVGTKSATFTYTSTLNTANYTNNYVGKNSNDVFYRFTLTKEMEVTISHCGSALSDTYLSLLNATGTRIAYNDDYSGVGKCSNTYHSYLKQVLPAGTYYVVSEGYSQNGNITTSISGFVEEEEEAEAEEEDAAEETPLSGSQDQNYIATRTYTKEDGSTYIDAIRYFDGLGRPIETVQVGITPNHQDLIAYQEYDAFGRESNSWLPAIASGNNGAFMNLTNFQAKSAAVYNNTVYNAAADTKPYSYPVYEPSPLNRVVKQYGPGQDWQSTTSDHPVSITYKTNMGSGYYCNYYYVSGDNLLKSSTYYTSKQLFVTETIDEDGHKSLEYKDKLGRIVLHRRESNYDTYYVYDDFGNLRYMLSPKAADALTANQTYTPTHDIIKKFAYVYWYDNRNRMIAKQIPGCEPVYYVYDKADRLVFSQDGEQRAKGEWAFSLPDAFGRTVLSGICKNSLNHETNPLQNTVVKAERPNPNTDNTYKGYNISGISLMTPTLLTVNYYDDYLFLGHNGVPNTTDITCETVSGYGTRYTGGDKGLLTGTLTSVLNADTPNYLYSILYYDYKGQLIQSKSSNQLAGGVEKEYVAYNFTGQPTKRKHVHSAIGKTTQTELYTYEYDHAGRLKQTKHQLNSGTEVVLADNTYDELGRLKTTQAAEKPNLKQTYGYNIRSWTSSISGQLYSEKLYYNEQFGQGTKYYNGNIATIRQGLPDLYIGYNYFYDAFSQLTEARTFWTGNGSNTPQYYNTYDTHYEYDKNGNMFRLTRIDDLNIEDLLIYYNGNQRTSITDWPTLYPSEYPDYYAVFTDYSNGAYVNFSYNLNGALKHDPYKRVEYQYNYLNLPNEITVPAIMGKIKYQYTADGRKLKATYEWCSSYSLNPIENTGKSSTCASLSMKTTDYVGNMIYENGNLKRILTDNGYIENNIYHFYLKDHLGNNAVVANTTGYSQQFNFYFPYGLTSGTESWNLGKQPYKFGGKEYETMHGLNLYDFVARPYDPAAGQFLTPDPMAEKYPWISPYAYCGNNPVNYIDPDGRDWVHRTVEGVEEVYYDRTVTSQEDVNKKYGEKSGVTHMADGSTLTQYNKDGSVKSQFTFTNDAKDNKYGTVTDMDGNVMDNSQITYGSNYTIFGTSDDSVNAETLHQNFFGTSYTGPNNPLTYGNESLGIAPQDSYQYLPRNLSEAASMRHDQAYDSQNAHGIAGALFNTNVIGADMELTKRNIENANRSYAPTKDRARSAATAVGFGAISAWKLLLLLPRL